MEDRRIARAPGSEVEVAGVPYRVEECMGRGGQALLYRAVAKQSDHYARYILKEFYPLEGAIRGTDGIVCARSPLLQHAFLRRRKAVFSGERLGTMARGQSHQILAPIAYCDKQGVAVMMEAAESCVTVSALMEEWAVCPPASRDQDYRDMGLIWSALEIMRSALGALMVLHEQMEILHGDITPDNLLWGRSAGGGTVFFLDFGCALPLYPREGGANRPVGITRGYSAPELEDPDAILTPAADLYSLSVLLLMLLMERGLGRGFLACVEAMEKAEIEQALEHLSAPMAVKHTLAEVILRGFCPNPRDRYQSAGEMLEQIEALVLWCQPKSCPLVTALPEKLHFYIPRPDETEVLTRFLEQGARQIFICAGPGDGKSVFADAFARDEQRYRFFRTTYAGSMEATILGLAFRNWSAMMEDGLGRLITKPIDQQFAEKMDLLRQYDDGCVLIVDNFDGPDHQAILRDLAGAKLETLSIRLLFTTRMDVPALLAEPAVVTLGLLPEEKLLELMKKRLAGKYQEEQLLPLIREVGCHPLTVDLLSRTLEQSLHGLTPERLLGNLRRGNFSDENWEQVASSYNRTSGTRQLLGYLQVLFDLSGLTPEARGLLGLCSLIPPSGMKRDYLEELVGKLRLFRKISIRETLDNLIRMGWVRYDRDTCLVSTHPLIRTVCLADKDATAGFLPFAKQGIETVWEDPFLKKEQSQPLTGMMEALYPVVEQQFTGLARRELMFCLGRLHILQRDSKKAGAYVEAGLAMPEQPDLLSWTRSHYRTWAYTEILLCWLQAEIADMERRYPDAIRWQKMVCEKSPAGDEQDKRNLMEHLLVLANLQFMVDEPGEATQTLGRANDLRKQIKPASDPELQQIDASLEAKFYGLWAEAAYLCEKYARAEEWAGRAVELYDRYALPQDGKYFQWYRIPMEVGMKFGAYQQVLDQGAAALSRLQDRGDDMPWHGKALCSLMAQAAFHMEDYSGARDHQKKAVEYLHALCREHPGELAFAHRAVHALALYCHKLGDPKAEQYCLEALALQLKFAPEDTQANLAITSLKLSILLSNS